MRLPARQADCRPENLARLGGRLCLSGIQGKLGQHLSGRRLAVQRVGRGRQRAGRGLEFQRRRFSAAAFSGRWADHGLLHRHGAELPGALERLYLHRGHYGERDRS